MTQDRNSRNHDSGVSGGNSSFEKHDRDMKTFRRSRACPIKTATQTGNASVEHDRPIRMCGRAYPITEASTSKQQKHHIWEMTRPWQISDMAGEIGASYRVDKGASLIHLWRAPEHRLYQS